MPRLSIRPSIVNARCWIAADSDVLLIESNDARTGVTDRFLEIQTWRPSASSTAVGEMLLQSWDDVIRVCPALPKAWSADFKPVRLSAAPKIDDLIAHWTFEELQGIWVRDVSGHRHHGMMVGSPMKLVEGKVGKALEFSGGAFVDVANAPDLSLSDAMTLAAEEISVLCK
jgi:hypothetical protein